MIQVFFLELCTWVDHLAFFDLPPLHSMVQTFIPTYLGIKYTQA